MQYKLRSLTLILLLLSFTKLVFADHVKLGKIEADLLEMTVYKQDSNAVAVILNDYGHIYYDFQHVAGEPYVLFTRTVRIKILKKEGLKWANWELGFYKGKYSEEELVKVRGYTYNLVGGKVEKTKFSNKIYQNDIHTRYFEEKFSFSDVKVGSVIDLEYTTRSPYVTSIPDWYFQYEIPVKRSELKVDIPEFYVFNKRVNGYVDLKKANTSTYNESVEIKVEYETDGYSAGTETAVKNYTILITQENLLAENVPAFDEENHITTNESYLSKVEFQFVSFDPIFGSNKNYASTWEQMNRALLIDDDFGEQYLPGSKIHKIIAQNVAEIKTQYESPYDQMIASYELVKNDMNWNEYSTIFIDKSLEDALIDKKGNTADINLILLSFLRDLDIESYPIVTKTQNRGVIYEVSNRIKEMNYVLVLAIIDGKEYLLDATDKDLGAGFIPKRAINNLAWIVDENNSGWYDLQKSLKSKTMEMITATMHEDGKISGSLSCSYSGYEGVKTRELIKSFSSKEEYIEDFSKDWPDADFKEFTIENIDDPYKPITEKIEVELQNSCIVSGDMIYMNPMLFHPISENPFKQEDRVYPVEYQSLENKVYILNLTTPEGYVIEEHPVNERVVLPDNAAEFTYQYKQVGQTIQIMVSFKINKMVFYADEYEYLRNFYNLVIQKHSNQIVFKQV